MKYFNHILKGLTQTMLVQHLHTEHTDNIQHTTANLLQPAAGFLTDKHAASQYQTGTYA